MDFPLLDMGIIEGVWRREKENLGRYEKKEVAINTCIYDDFRV